MTDWKMVPDVPPPYWTVTWGTNAFVVEAFTEHDALARWRRKNARKIRRLAGEPTGDRPIDDVPLDRALVRARRSTPAEIEDYKAARAARAGEVGAGAA